MIVEFSKDSLGPALAEKNSKALDSFFYHHAASCYSFCFSLCLENPKHAKILFCKTAELAFKNTDLLYETLDVWFYQALHKTWEIFSRFNSELKSQNEDIKLDWSRPIGRQHADALKILNPLEREVLLYRFYNQFVLTKISQVTGMPANKISQVFHQAINKLTKL